MPGTVTCKLVTMPLGQLEPPGLGGSTIYLWHGQTAALLASYTKYFPLLSDPEKEQAKRYYHAADRQRYVIQHGILRVLLARYLDLPNTGLSYQYNSNKKPYLADTYNKPCHFNLSHSGGDFLISIGPVELGVDIEKVNPLFEFMDIAAQWFSAGEVDFINNSADPTGAFFLLWTRKEALLKACGTGIDDDLPLMPALNGQYDLPAGYAPVNWLTTSFKLSDTFMVSLTQPTPRLNIQLNYLNAADF